MANGIFREGEEKSLIQLLSGEMFRNLAICLLISTGVKDIMIIFTNGELMIFALSKIPAMIFYSRYYLCFIAQQIREKLHKNI